MEGFTYVSSLSRLPPSQAQMREISIEIFMHLVQMGGTMHSWMHKRSNAPGKSWRSALAAYVYNYLQVLTLEYLHVISHDYIHVVASYLCTSESRKTVSLCYSLRNLRLLFWRVAAVGTTWWEALLYGKSHVETPDWPRICKSKKLKPLTSSAGTCVVHVWYMPGTCIYMYCIVSNSRRVV
jgi:hypothetical protein